MRGFLPQTTHLNITGVAAWSGEFSNTLLMILVVQRIDADFIII
jgi:hypothetical protein